MELIEWDNTLYSVQIEEFDNHHKKIVNLINKLHKAMLKGEGKQVLGAIFLELKNYTQYHFNAEEQKMIGANYPDFAKHKNEHKELLLQLSKHIQDYEWNKREVTIDTLRFLKEWLFNHIQISDKKYSSFLK